MKILEAFKIMKIAKKLNVPREEQQQSNPSPDHAATRLVKTRGSANKILFRLRKKNNPTVLVIGEFFASVNRSPAE